MGQQKKKPWDKKLNKESEKKTRDEQQNEW
jgi:hypothetical protein